MLMAPLDYLDSWTALCAPSPAPDSECAWVSDKICGNRSKEEEIGGQRRTGRTTLSFSHPSFGVPVLFIFITTHQGLSAIFIYGRTTKPVEATK